MVSSCSTVVYSMSRFTAIPTTYQSHTRIRNKERERERERGREANIDGNKERNNLIVSV